MTRIKKRKEKASKARKLALAHAAEKANDKEKTNFEQSTNPTSDDPSDEATFPTENNGNSHLESFASIAKKMDDEKSVTEKTKKTSFHFARDLHAKTDLADDDTVRFGNENIRVSFMVAIPSKDIDEEEAPMEAIRRLNGMVKCLINKMPSIKIGLWDPEAESRQKFLLELPEDVEVAEKYVFDYNRFISPGSSLYGRLNLFYNPNRTSRSAIEEVIFSFRKPRIQNMSIAHSDATSPCQMGSFTGSVRSMTTSRDFYNSLKKMFRLKHLGLWWAFPKSEVAWNKDNKKWTMFYELDRTDVEAGKNDAIIAYFNKYSSSVDSNFFGTAMSVTPNFTPFLDDETKMRITKLAKKQMMIGSNLKSIQLTGVQVLNWADDKKESTLHRELMLVESITEKKVVKSDGTEKFKGRLFYAIIPNQRNKSVTFYFSKANSEEARSVARGLPLFIRDHFKLEPSFFCGSNEIAECMEGDWNHKNRTFLTREEKNEQQKFSHVLDTVTAVKESYISEEHRLAMAAEGDDVGSLDTRLTKGDVAPQKAKENDACSTLTGDTRESKAKAYAAEETKKVSLQYVKQIDIMKTENDNKVAYLQAQLDVVLKRLKVSESDGPQPAITIQQTHESDEESPILNTTGVYHSKGKASDNITEPEEDEDLSVEEEFDLKEGMSGLSESSDDDEPIIVGVRNRLKKTSSAKAKSTPHSPFRKNKDNKNVYVMNEMNDFEASSPTLRKKSKTATVTPREVRYSERYSSPPLASSEGSLL